MITTLWIVTLIMVAAAIIVGTAVLFHLIRAALGLILPAKAAEAGAYAVFALLYVTVAFALARWITESLGPAAF